MSNIGNKLMAGFYATPVEVGEQLKQLFNFSAPGAAFDPTCGKGHILKQLCGGNEMIRTYGVEIEKTRADIAKGELDKVINAPIESMRISNDAFSFIYLNPPYDTEIVQQGERTRRKEAVELERSIRYLAPKGVLCFVVSGEAIAASAKFLATHFSEIQIVRFDDEFYEDYKQCIFIGRKKTATKKALNEEFYNIFMKFKEESFVKKSVRRLSQLVGHKVYEIGETNPKLKLFSSKIESKEEHIKLIKENLAFQVIHEKLTPRSILLDSQPIINVSQGQMGLLLASGAVNGLLTEDVEGKNQHVVQGLELVSTVITKERMESEEIKTTERTKREVSVKIITPTFVRKLQ